MKNIFSENCQILDVKFSIYLNRGVFKMKRKEVIEVLRNQNYFYGCHNFEYLMRFMAS